MADKHPDKHQVRLGAVQETTRCSATLTLTLFRASSPAADGRAATTPEDGPA
jgi:hypothetical protein